MTAQSTLRRIETVQTNESSDGTPTVPVLDGPWSRKVVRKHASKLPHKAQLSASDVEQAKALYCAKTGATRL
jgi:hypothetical protein